jgi:phosphatidylinositol alpha-mannosyltransferase
MRVGLVCPYSLDVPGGVQNHVLGLARALRGRGHQVCVLAPAERTASAPPALQTVRGVVPVPFNGAVARVAFGPRVAARTRRWLVEGAFDIVHIHDPATPSVSLLALWATDATVVATFHAAPSRSRMMPLASALLRTSMGKIAVGIAVSDTARDMVVRHLGAEPIVIPNGICCREFELARPRDDWSRPGPTVVFLGRTGESRKGLSVVLAAFPAVTDAHPDARLLVAGPQSRVTQVPRDVRDHVRFLGTVSDADRASLLASATVFVAPQLGGESFGVVLVEAMAAGAAVAASDLPAFRGLLEGGRLGTLFAPGDPRAAARAVNALLEDDSLRQRLRVAAGRAVQRFDWSVLAPEIEAVYEGVVRTGSARSQTGDDSAPPESPADCRGWRTGEM